MSSRSILVLGGSGLVGSRLVEQWGDRYSITAPTHQQLDVLDPAALQRAIEGTRPDSVVNATAWAGVDDAEAERGNTGGRVYLLNAAYPCVLAELCRASGAHLVHLSTDYVFDGTNGERPYTEDDASNPLGWYAQTKRSGEEAVLRANPQACIARIEMPFTGRAHHKRDLARTVVARLESGTPVQGVIDQRITPVFLNDAAEALGELVEARYSGIIHVASSAWITPFDFARAIAQRLGLRLDLIEPTTFERFAATRPAPRPQHSWLDVSRFANLFGATILRSVEQELDAWAKQLAAVGTRG